MNQAEQQSKIEKKIASLTLCGGLGNSKKGASAIVAINLALRRRRSEDIPESMSGVVGEWIWIVHDCMPPSFNNSPEWRSLIPPAAFTGKGHEIERMDLILDWMWAKVLPSFQLFAEREGVGEQWKHMTDSRSLKSFSRVFAPPWARSIADLAESALIYGSDARTYGPGMLCIDIFAPTPVAVKAAAFVADIACRVGIGALEGRDWRRPGGLAASERAWGEIDPCALLSRLIAVGVEK